MSLEDTYNMVSINCKKTVFYYKRHGIDLSKTFSIFIFSILNGNIAEPNFECQLNSNCHNETNTPARFISHAILGQFFIFIIIMDCGDF